MTWLYDRIKATSPNAVIVLYETWARQETLTSFYPVYFPNRDDDAEPARLLVSRRGGSLRARPFHVADVPDGHLRGPLSARSGSLDYHGLNYNLHDTDRYHASADGQYLNGLVLYGVIYNRSVAGRTCSGATRPSGRIFRRWPTRPRTRRRPAGPPQRQPPPDRERRRRWW